MRQLSTEQKTEKRQAFIKWLKSLIAPGIFAALLVVAIIFVVNYQEPVEEEEIVPMNAYADGEGDLVMESERLKFTLDKTTTWFTVKVKSTGKEWSSNPVDAAEDPLAMAAEKGRVQSTLTLTYTDDKGLETLMNNFDYSIKNGLYSFEQDDDSITVNYSIGDVQKEFKIPPVCKAEDYDKWKSQMPKSAGSFLSQYYKKYDINKLGKKDDKDQLLADYPILADEVIYILRDGASDSVKKKLQSYFEEAGYSDEDYSKDKELSNASSSNDKPVFDISITYRLDGDDLVVEIPYEKIRFKKDYPIYKINPLPFFGAGSQQDDGFMFVPEGGGALIRFNNGKTSQNAYYANVYGWDMAQSRKAVVHDTSTDFATFGVSEGNDSFICTLEEGAPYAAVQADVSGKFNSYNYINAEYSAVLREKFDVGNIANSDVYVFLPELPKETLTQRYTFVDSGSYVDMAKTYQKQLLAKNPSMDMNTDASTPVVAEFIGAADKVRQVAGVPVSRPLRLTSYKDAAGIYDDLYNSGITNLSAKYIGWCNGGVNQKMLSSVKTVSQLGSKKDLMAFSNLVSGTGNVLYLDGITQYAKDSDLFDGFFAYRDSARFLSKEMAELYKYSTVTYAQYDKKDPYYLLHEGLSLKMADNLVNASNKYSAAVSFQDIGSALSADYYRKNMVSRQQSLYDQSAKLSDIANAGKAICINAGNDYAIGSATCVTNMDLRGTKYTIIDEYVPFYQMAIHGYVDYTGAEINISGDPEDEVLCSAEYGAGLSFLVMKESCFELQNTKDEYTKFYAGTYSDYKEELLAVYNKYNEELGGIFAQEMTGHENLTAEVSVTTYADGTKVYVNYGYDDYKTDDGVTVPARDYLAKH